MEVRAGQIIEEFMGEFSSKPWSWDGR